MTRLFGTIMANDKKRLPYRIVMAGASVIVVGCAETGPVQPARDGTYTVASNSGLGRYSETDEPNKAMKAATDYCNQFGMHMHALDTTSRPGRLRVSYAVVTFKCAAD